MPTTSSLHSPLFLSSTSTPACPNCLILPAFTIPPALPPCLAQPWHPGGCHYQQAWDPERRAGPLIASR
ncbi:hypothetical protein E2C01_080568 [Portunus trituberculatus]|uniref:Uncharacterized protein n=1 Tax=Portunus trituberculatus TaxID=210409 RepID=A0A5B7ITL4_PORTR|nr:hypothetical protein [Portunus trituberculatus]